MRAIRLFIGLTLNAGLILISALLALPSQAASPTPPLTTPAWTASGEGARDHFGYAVGTAGDVNGDGFDDVIVGAYHYGNYAGRVYVYAGSADGLSAAPIFTATGHSKNLYFGRAVGTAGDVNGDGYDDVIIGADRYKAWTGQAFVYAGGANGLSAAPIFTASGETVNNHFGYAVGTAGDVNGDGYDDVIVGAYHYDEFTGRAYVYAGSANGLSATPLFTATGESREIYFGRAVGTTGDVNGDGYDDVIVGAPHHDDFTGRAYVYAGGANGMNAAPMVTVSGEGKSTSFGRSVGTTGDVNGDGYADVIIGADGYGDFVGRVYVYAGGSSGLSAAPTFTASGEDINNHFGHSTGTAGDVNGDGYSDVIVGAYRYDDLTGRAYVYTGSQGDGPLSPAQPDTSYLVVSVLVAAVTILLIFFAVVRRAGRK